MSALASARVGWCPGALAPMESGDGFILRVKPRGATLSLDQLAAVAQVSSTYGSGAIDLTSRANLQVRGVGNASLAAAAERLDRAGLLDPSPAAEAARNVVSSPLAGLDPDAVLDVRPAVAMLETRLIEDPKLHPVPAKFGIVVDDGGTLGLAEVPADLRFEAFRDAAGAAFAVRLGGAESGPTARCRPGEIADAASALIRVFLDARDPDICRMRHLAVLLGAEAIFRRAGLAVCSLPGALAGQASTAPTARYGFRRTVGQLLPRDEQGITSQPATLGVGAPFGRLTSTQLDILARTAAACGATEIRLTPWSAILVPRLEGDGARAIATHCGAAGLIVDPEDPRLRVAACTGAPGCRRASTRVLDDAARLASRLPPVGSARVLLHVSGCSKGCAHPGKVPLTLVAHNGCYDVVVDGAASDRPASGGLSLEAAAAWVEAPAGEPQA